jgi:membrane associated rhomboid family serine protease
MVVPIYDDNPFRLPHRPVVTWILIGVNIGVFLLELAADNPTDLIATFGLTPAALIGDVSIPGALAPILTLFTYMFLHADIGHILGNMIFLWVFADDIEEALGRRRFLAFYLLCGMIAGIGFVASDPHSQTPLIGASGAISGIVIAYAMLRPCAKVTALVFGFIPLRISAFWIIGVFVVIQFINLESSAKSEVAYWCHLIGMLAGGALFPIMRPPGVRLFQCIRTPKAPAVPATRGHLPGAPGG